MADYIMLFRFTEKALANMKESPQRINQAKKVFEAAGAKVKTLYAVLGRYDTIWVIEAPDDETIARLSLQISSMGNVHTETLRAFSEAEYINIISKL